jgi:hypothetical protein
MLVLLWRIDFGHIISPGFVTCVRTTQQLCWFVGYWLLQQVTKIIAILAS